MITNETIIKAAKAAGLDAFVPHLLKTCDDPFNPLHNDTDNAMIRRGAEIDLFWCSSIVCASATIKVGKVMKPLYIDYPVNNGDKAQAEREAVILCAASKWTAMQGESKDAY